MYCLVLVNIVKVVPGITKYHQVLPGITRYHKVLSGIARNNPSGIKKFHFNFFSSLNSFYLVSYSIT